MASIRKEILVNARPELVWDALRDVGALHTRLVPGFVTDTRMESDVRVVTFGNGMVAREHILAVDEAQRRVAWAILDAPFRHYNGAAQVMAEGADRSRFVWTTDLLPNEAADNVEAMMAQGVAVIKKTLERAA